MSEPIEKMCRVKPNFNAVGPVKITGYNTEEMFFDVVMQDNVFLYPEILLIPKFEGTIPQANIGAAEASDYLFKSVLAASRCATTAGRSIIYPGDFLTSFTEASILCKPGGGGWGFDHRGEYVLKIGRSGLWAEIGIGALKLKWPYLYIGSAGSPSDTRGIHKTKIRNQMQYKVISGGGINYELNCIVRPAPLARTVDDWYKALSSIYGIELDSNDNVIGVGDSYIGNNLFHYDNDGNLNWDYNAGGTLYGVCKDSLDNVIVVGTRNYDEDTIADSEGLWATSTSYTVGDVVELSGKYYECIQNHTSDSGTPWVNKPGVGSDWQSYWEDRIANVRKLDKNGNFQWRYDTGTGEALAVNTDSGYNIYIACDRNSDSESLIKLSNSGEHQWGYDTGDTCRGIDVDSDDNIIIVGDRAQDEDGDTASVRKLNNSGIKQWEYDLTVEGYYLNSFAIEIDYDNSIYISMGVSGKWRSLVKLDSDGDYQWYRDVGCVCSCITAQKGFVIAGVYFASFQYQWFL